MAREKCKILAVPCTVPGNRMRNCILRFSLTVERSQRCNCVMSGLLYEVAPGTRLPCCMYGYDTPHTELLTVILLPDEASFTRDGVHNSGNVHMCSHDNKRETSAITFQRRFSVIVL
jgi:hypothetical protein